MTVLDECPSQQETFLVEGPVGSEMSSKLSWARPLFRARPCSVLFPSVQGLSYDQPYTTCSQRPQGSSLSRDYAGFQGLCLSVPTPTWLGLESTTSPTLVSRPSPTLQSL